MISGFFIYITYSKERTDDEFMCTYGFPQTMALNATLNDTGLFPHLNGKPNNLVIISPVSAKLKLIC